MALDTMMRKPFAPFECSILSPSVGAVRLVTLFLLWFCINTAWAKSFVAFGPEELAGKSVTTKSFQVLNPAVPYKLHIDNGGAGSQYAKVSSGIVTLNGIDVVKPNDFNQTVRSIEKPLALSAINNLMVELRSNPTSGITLQVIGEDNDQPTIKPSIQPQANEAGWHQNDAVVSFSCDDKTSGIATCSSPVTVSGEGAAQVIQGSATDKAGNTSSTSVTINLDLTSPAITAASEPPPNAAGWHKSDVTVHFNCSDALSGIASCSSPLTVTAEGAGQTLQGSATDKAGNTSTTNTTVNLDLTPPTLQITSPADGSVVPVNTVSISGTVDDSLSGIAAVSCNGTTAGVSGSSFSCSVDLQGGANTISVLVTDAAGNSASAEMHVTLSAAPLNITEPANLSFFNFSPIRIAGTVAAQTSAVTVNGISASVSGGNWSASVPLSEGNNTLTAVATKNDGTVNTASIQVTLDTTPPRVTVDSPADGFKTVEETVTVTGIVNDIVVGTVNSGQAQVTVNGIKAEVANRTYRADAIPLQLGVNSIQVIGKDQVGNSATTTIKVTREATNQPFIKTVSGNNQRGAIASALEQPLVVQLLDGTTPAAHVPVLFKVVENDGYLRLDNGKKLQLIAVNTDADGKAQATLTLGHRAGAGNNIVEAYAVGYQGTAVFTASGTPQAAAHINVDAGTNQFGATHSALPLPFVAVVTDAGHNRLGGVPVTFTVTQGGGTLNGQAAFETVSDSDGRALAVLTLGPDAGQDNNVVEANFPGNTGFAAAFAASAKIPGDPAQTSISGVVQDNSNAPIPGVTMRLYTTHQLINHNGVNNNQPLEVVTPVVTDADGHFKIAPAPVGFFKLMADGATAPSTDQHFPTLEYDLVTVAGGDNGVGSPIYLPALDPDAKVCVDSKTGGTLKIASSPGFSLTIAPGSATFPGGSKTGCVTVTPVNPDKVPMVPGFGQQPRYVVTIQPAGTTFNPPAAITIPNMDGLAPHAKTEMYSYDHDLAAFVAIGSATVSADGSVIASDPGIGVMKAGWHCGGDPNTTGSSGSLGVTLIADESVAGLVGSTLKFTAKGTPPLDGEYEKWEIIDNPAVAKFDNSPGCPSQQQCPNTMTLSAPGTATAQVGFQCTTPPVHHTTSEPVKVQAVVLKIKSVSFNDDITIYKDIVGAAPEIKDPVWQSAESTQDGKVISEPVAYVQGSTINITATFKVDPEPEATIKNITIEGHVDGLGTFKATESSLNISSNTKTVDFKLDTPLPANQTAHFNPKTIKWQYKQDGDYQQAGSSDHEIYVTLAKPTQSQVFLTTLALGVADGGAHSQAAAMQKTWAQFAGPADVHSWDGKRALYYYREGLGTNKYCTSYEYELLTSQYNNGSCGAWALLLKSALAVNGISSEEVHITTKDGLPFLVKDWTPKAESYSGEDYRWKMEFNPAAKDDGLPPYGMVPSQPDSVYGDLKSESTLSGQNTDPPSEKIFERHIILKALPNDGPQVYYDPSYGEDYGSDKTQAEIKFENDAVYGYRKHFDLNDDPNVYRVKSSSGLNNIKFNE